MDARLEGAGSKHHEAEGDELGIGKPSRAQCCCCYKTKDDETYGVLQTVVALTRSPRNLALSANG